jgi:tetratricopeptide (TPR) repeat protein
MNIDQEARDPERLSARLRFHRNAIAEESEAAAICDDVLHGPSRWWRNTLFQAGDGVRTAGMVTVLIQRSEEAMRQVPLDALELTEIAAEISSALDAERYPYDHVYKVRGQALRQQAYVLSYLGRQPEALRIAGLAGLFLGQIPIALPELARLDLVRSNIARNMENFDEAVALAREAGEKFLVFGARTSWLNAVLYEASARYCAGNLEKALDIWRSIEQYDSLLTPEQRAARIHNMALCAGAAGEFDDAARLYARAAAEFERLGATVNRVKCTYSIGRAMNAAGKYEDAVPVLAKAEVELEAAGLESDAALAALMRVEALLALGRPKEVPEICRGLVERFTRSGITGAAMTALAYLRETLALSRATPAIVRDVHQFLSDTKIGSTRAFATCSEPSVMHATPRFDS